ncbi:hypothetical protein BUE80_DR012912, partial [Diplocarpon rosae]
SEALAGRVRNYASGSTEPEKPLVVHCTAGKDRTGLISALVLSLCGVDEEIIAYDYSSSEVELKGGVHVSDFEDDQRLGGAEGYVFEKRGLTSEEVRRIGRNQAVDVPAVHDTHSL